jgi:hypothetical protein
MSRRLGRPGTCIAGYNRRFSSASSSRWNIQRCLIFAHDAIPNSPASAAARQSVIFLDVHGFEPLRHLHSVTICTSSAHNRAPCDGIPRCVRPLDLRLGHWHLVLIEATEPECESWPALLPDGGIRPRNYSVGLCRSRCEQKAKISSATSAMID